MKKKSFRAKLHYSFDNFMSRGTAALIGGLAVVSGLFILLCAVIVTAIGLKPEEADSWSFPESLWGILMRTLDTGTVGGDSGWFFRLFMLLVTFGGIFVISTLIGLITSGIESKLQDLRTGRSQVIETDHIVILGWSFQIFTLLSELLSANTNRSDSCIVILSPEDKVIMEETLQKSLGKKHRTRIVCRTGTPSDISDLARVNIAESRSIIVLNPYSEKGDIDLIKTLLAITNIPRENPKPYHIVAQVQERKTLEIIELINGNQVEPILRNDLISRIIVQTCRQSGLSAVYMDLFDFEGNEIYFVKEPSLVGRSYGEIIFLSEKSAVMGFQNPEGKILLNPSENEVFTPGSKLIVIAEDDDTTAIGKMTIEIDETALVFHPDLTLHPEHTLILGWNNRIFNTIIQLDAYVAPDSAVTVVADIENGLEKITQHCPNLSHQTVHFYQGSPVKKEVLTHLPITEFNHILILSADDIDPEASDAQTLVILLQLRQLTRTQNQPIVTEMIDPRNQALAEVAKPDDFVISEEIISRLLAQIAEQKHLNQVFSSLLSSDGAEIYLKPASNYVVLGKPVNFYTVVESAKRKGESAIGYRLKVDANNRAKSYGVIINPQKSNLISFTEEDRVIVVANN
jgi:voltage-gated potassium channel Kch